MLPILGPTGEKFDPKGIFVCDIFRRGKLLERVIAKNTVTTEGKNKLLDVMFHGTTQITSWYIGLINNAGFSAISAADTMASHAGWVELDTAGNTKYSEANRPDWSEGAAGAGSITNASAAVFTIIDTCAINGFFLSSSNVKAGTAGTLWCAGSFTAVRNVVNGDTLNITYTLSC